MTTTSPDGWTTIISKSRRHATTTLSTLNNFNHVTSPRDQPSPHALEEIHRTFSRHQRQWLRSACRKQLREVMQRLLARDDDGELASAAAAGGGCLMEQRQKGQDQDQDQERGKKNKKREITKCICLGLGSLRRESVTRRASMFQLVAALDMLDIIIDSNTPTQEDPFSLTSTTSVTTSTFVYNPSAPASTSPEPSIQKQTVLRIYAQDPIFHPLDAAFLASLGVVVLSHPYALELIDGATLLFAPHCERGFLLPVLGGGGSSSSRKGEERVGKSGGEEDGREGTVGMNVMSGREEGGVRVEGTPAVLVICNDLGRVLDGPLSPSIPASELHQARSFLTGRQEAAFPSFEEVDEFAFNDLRIYC